jgi:hypothetical protein
MNINAIIIFLLSFLFIQAPIASMENTEKAIHIEFDLPKAQGIDRGTMVISSTDHPKMDNYFKNINALPKAQIPYTMTDISFLSLVYDNEVALVSMNDSCLALPKSGVKIITVDSLSDCVGMFIFHEEVGCGAAHITIGTKPESLGNILNPFLGSDDVHITLLTSYKSNLLNRIYRLLKKQKFSIDAVYVNNIIQQMSPDGKIFKRYINPADISYKTKMTQSQIVHCTALKFASPIGAIIDTSNGQISFVASSAHGNFPHQSSGIIKNARDKVHSIPCWAANRYKQSVKPYEDQDDVNIAFVQYPISNERDSRRNAG